MAAPEDDTPWLKILAWIQVALLALLFLAPSIALGMIAVEGLVIGFWLLPVFLYQTLVKRLPARQGIRRAAQSLIDAFSYF
ncbi:hypothetical protein [Pseudoduganella violaceinigra]|uniref:hypothetical protein n=1 Tax=Pseudoduganella violaceinigra TaxID=246602 RepID=UPI00040531D1|nr:hypothetical protein [Pseudoduganella violaceinigra]